MENITTSEDIKKLLHKALGRLEPFQECALLNYPDHLNIGDHLIWLGTIFYLTNVLGVAIKYAASARNFSAEIMEKRIGKAPILLHGGGSLGDLWPEQQRFREQIILKYTDRLIVSLPQSIHFNNPANLDKAAKVFNSHPNLVLFVRDQRSYEIALQHFSNCQLIMAPDMAFQISEFPDLLVGRNQTSAILYHCRKDHEMNPNFLFNSLGVSKLVVEDWVSYQWIIRGGFSSLNSWYWKIPGMVRLVREGWQRRLKDPLEWMSRQMWQLSSFEDFSPTALYNPSIYYYRSWQLVHGGIYQFKKYRLVITNRLHGHILCTILGIPHILLPNSYYKNELFYKTWTHQIAFCKFIKDKTHLATTVAEFLEESKRR